MAKVLIIVAQEGFRDEELLVPKEILEKAGHTVKVASITRAKATGSMGATILPDIAVYEANPEYFDAVVVAGGPGSPKLAKTKEVVDLVEAAHKNGKIVAAICLGPMTLAAAGVISGKRATVYPSPNGIEALKNGGANYKAEPVIVSGKVVTADSPQSAGEFGATIVELLKE
jgi:protease I